VADHGSYNIATYIEKRKKKRKIHYNELITEESLLSDSFMKEKSLWIEFKECNKMLYVMNQSSKD